MKKGREAGIFGRWALLYIIAFAAGICITNVWKSEIVDNGGFLGEYTLQCMRQVKINYTGYFWYLLSRRVGVAVFLAVLSSTYLGFAGIYLYIGWLGAAAGIFFAGAGMRYGAKGMLLVFGGMLPHQIILIPWGIFFIYWCYRMCAELYYKNGYCETAQSGRKQFILRKAIQFQIIIGVVIIGCLLECYVNPYIITKLLKFF